MGSILVNTFHSREEVVALEGVEDIVGVSPDNFLSLLGDYHFNNDVQPLKCCCIKKGKRLCGQDHRNGYIVELKDGRKSLLGSTCVREFDDNGELRKSINRYENQKNYEERVSYINHLFYDKDKVLAELRKDISRLEEIKEYCETFCQSIPEKATNKIVDMSRRGNGDVVVQLSFMKEVKNKKTGRLEREEYVANHTIGRLYGLKLFHMDAWTKLYKNMSENIKTLEELVYIDKNVGYKKVAMLYNKLQELTQLSSQVGFYYSDKLVFERSDKESLCFLVPAVDDRLKLVRMWYWEKTNCPLGINEAKLKLNELDDSVTRSNNAQSLTIP